MKRKIRRVLEIALPVSGMGVIFGSVLWGSNSLQLQVLFVLFGILILEAGVWGLAIRLLPNERRYLGLREEGNHFIELIRELNRAAVAREEGDAGDEHEERYQGALEQMHASVRRMGELAGKDESGSIGHRYRRREGGSVTHGHIHRTGGRVGHGYTCRGGRPRARHSETASLEGSPQPLGAPGLSRRPSRQKGPCPPKTLRRVFPH